MVVKINLLLRANQFGKKISKFSFVESAYFLANTVKGQNILNKTKTIPSPTTKPMEIQVKEFILLQIPEYKI